MAYQNLYAPPAFGKESPIDQLYGNGGDIKYRFQLGNELKGYGNGGSGNYAQNNMDSFGLASGESTELSNQRSMYDPWGYYRPSAAKQLATQSQQTDPAVGWRDKLTSMMTGEFSPDDPSYQFRFDQGQQALERSQGSRGLLNSGNAAIELQQYGQGAASQEYGAQFDRLLKGMTGVESQYNTQQSRLMDLAGVNVGPSVLSNNLLGVSSQASDNNYRANIDKGIASATGGSSNPYAGYSFG